MLSDDRHELLSISLLVARSLGDIFGKLRLLVSYYTLARSGVTKELLQRPCSPYRTLTGLAEEAATAIDGAERSARRNGAQQPSTGLGQ